MIDAFYTLSFESNFGLSGTGVAVFKDGKVFGGDSLMAYVGQYSIESNVVSAQLAVEKYANRSDMESVVGLDNFHLKIQGHINDSEFSLSGNVVEDSSRTITIHAKKHSEL